MAITHTWPRSRILRTDSNTKQSEVVTALVLGLTRAPRAFMFWLGKRGCVVLKRLICAAQISGSPFLRSRVFTLGGGRVSLVGERQKKSKRERREQQDWTAMFASKDFFFPFFFQRGTPLKLIRDAALMRGAFPWNNCKNNSTWSNLRKCQKRAQINITI